MGILSFPDSASASGTGAGALVYTFEPLSGSEYLTPLLSDDALYSISSVTSDPRRSAGISLEVYTLDTDSVPSEIVTVFHDRPAFFSGAVGKIRVLTGSYYNPAYNAAELYNDNMGSSTLQIRKYPKTEPLRTGSDNDTLGDIYVHVEAHGDWSDNGIQSGLALSNGENGYGWNSTRKWAGWSYNWNYTGVYRIGRNNETGASGPATNATLHGTLSNARTFQYKPLNSMTWTNLTPVPDEIQFYNTGDFSNNNNQITRAHIYDTELITYVMFRKRNTPITDQTMSNGQIGRFNQLLYKYEKATQTWTLLQAYAITTWGDPSHTYGPKMFFIATQAGTPYLFPWQIERTSNTFFRYNLVNGDRSQATDSTVAWNEGAFVNGYFFVSPTSGIGNNDTSAADYQVYNPATNAWSSINPPSRTATNGTTEASTWFRGGTVFRYNSTSVGVIGRRTYTSNNTTPANNDRYWGARFFIYDFSQGVGANWIDKTDDLGNYYPHIMRPSASVDGNRYVWQAQSSDWDGRFLLIRTGESEYRSRGNYEYVNVKKPKQVTRIGATGRPRGEMSVGSWSVLAFAHIREMEVAPHTYQTNGTVAWGSETISGYQTWGCELIYTDGTIKYGPQHLAVQNAIYNPQRNEFYISGWEFVYSQYVTTTSAAQWAPASYVVDEKTGVFTKVWSDWYTLSGNRNAQEAFAAGLAYNDASHFYRPFDSDSWYIGNLIGNAGNGSEYRNRALTDYKFHPHIPGTNNQRTSQALSMASDQRTNQVVQWGKGPMNYAGIPEGTLFWDGSTLRMYCQRDVQFPFSGDVAARSTTNTVGRQTGWRIIYTTPSVGARTTHTWYGTPKVWRDNNFAICQNSTMETYYVFDLNNLYTREPKIINSHLPIESSSTPNSNTGNSATLGNNANRWIKNAANVGGTEIIYGHTDFDGIRSWFNDNIYIVRDYPTPSANLLDKN